MFAELGHLSQYSKTSFRHWGMKVECPFAWVERRLALKIGLVAARVVMDGGRCWAERDREWRGDECVTSDNPSPLTVNQERAWSPSERQLEKVAFTLSSHRRVSVTQQWQGQLVRPRPPQPHNQTRTSCQRATTRSPPRSRKLRNQRNANAIPSSNTKINRLQSFLVRMKTLLILQKQRTFSLLPQSSLKRTSIPAWRIRSWKPSKCASDSPITSLKVAHLPHFLGSTHRACWTGFFHCPTINQSHPVRSEHYSRIRPAIHSGR